MFQEGEKIVCINNTDYHYDVGITSNKDLDLYEVYTVNFVGSYEQVELEELPGRNYYIKRFISLTEHRKDKLDKIKERICLNQVIK